MYKYVFFCFSVALNLSLRNNSMFNYDIRTVTVFHIIGRKFGMLQNIMFSVSKLTLNVQF